MPQPLLHHAPAGTRYDIVRSSRQPPPSSRSSSSSRQPQPQPHAAVPPPPSVAPAAAAPPRLAPSHRLPTPATHTSLPGAPPLLAPSASRAASSPSDGAFPAASGQLAAAAADDDGEAGSDASSFHDDDDTVDLGSDDDEFVRPLAAGGAPAAASHSGPPAGGLGRASAPDVGAGGSLGRAVGPGLRDEKASVQATGGVRDWLGVPGLPPPAALRPTELAPPLPSSPGAHTTASAVPPPRTSSFRAPSSARASPPPPSSIPPHAAPPPPPRSTSHGRTASQNDVLRRELPALHTTFPPAKQSAAEEKQREAAYHAQLQARERERTAAAAAAGDGVVSPPPYAHTPTTASGGRSTPAAGKGKLADPHDAHYDGHAHRDGYTNSPSLFRLPDVGGSTAAAGGSAYLPGPGSSVLSPQPSSTGIGGLGLGGDALFDPSSFQLPPAPTGLLALLLAPRAAQSLLPELGIRDVLSLWRALGDADRARLERSKEAIEECRVWALGWAGYVRGAMDGVGGAREGWDKVGWEPTLGFLASLLEPPTTAFPPTQIQHISLSTLLLRAAHASRPPAGPHLIPFEEEDVLPQPLQPTLAALNPKTRMRGLPAGRLLVLPSPLAAQPQGPAGGGGGSKSAVEGRNGPVPPPKAGQGSLRGRRSSISESVGIHWGGLASRSHGGTPSTSFSAQLQPQAPLRLAPSSASIYSVDNHSKAKLAPPPPRVPEPRRYEFQQPLPGQPGRRHRRQTSDSQSVMSSATGYGAPSVHRQRGVSAGPSSVHMLAGGLTADVGGAGGGGSGGPRSAGGWQADLANAPPLPSFVQPLRKSASKDGSWTSLSAGGGGRGGGGAGSRWETTSSSESSSGGRLTRRRSSALPLVEPLFLTLTSPYKFGRAPLIKIVCPLPSDVPWPSGPALKLCHRHLDAAGLLAKMRLGDLVENLAVSWRTRKAEGPLGAGWTTGTMVYIPPYLHPLSTAYSQDPTAASPVATSAGGGVSLSKTAHLPASLDMFLLPPTYYHSVIPPPYLIFLDLRPFAARVTETLRLAHQRAEVLSAGGDVLGLDQWVHEAGFFVEEGFGGAGSEPGPWEGTMVTLEADGTKEGKDEILSRVDPASTKRRPWEVVASKSTRGSVWLKLVRENAPSTA